MKQNLFPFLSALIVCTTYGVPLAGFVLLLQHVAGLLQTTIACVVGPFLAVVVLVLLAGFWSLPFQRHIVPGRFPRDLNHPVYFGRRVYSVCWSCVYSCSPAYALCLSLPAFRWMAFRLFGYRGHTKFFIQTDTWIRDLPLLDFGEGAYLSSRATVGTNLALGNALILVDRVKISKGAHLGEFSRLAPGVVVGESAEISVGCSIGIKAQLGAMCRIGSGSTVGHGAKLSERVLVGAKCCVGPEAKIAPGIILPSGTSVSSRTSVSDQKDVLRSSPAREQQPRTDSVSVRENNKPVPVKT